MKKTAAILLLIFSAYMATTGQSTEFSYQGSLKDGANPANGNYDFEIRLFDVAAGGAQLVSQQRLGVAVTDGVFIITANFGAIFNGDARYVEIAVRPAGSGNPFTTLSPRQLTLSTPYAIKSLASNVSNLAANSQQLGGVAANQYVVTGDPRMTDSRAPTAGSANYIQNQTAAQQLASFNINASGEAEFFNSRSDYRFAGFRVLGTLGVNNLFAGVFAGANNSGADNTFLGREAGQANTTGSSNTFVGSWAGRQSLGSGANSFFGARAGTVNSTGSGNAFFGASAGEGNTIGGGNSFFGQGAGFQTTIGNGNSFFGQLAGAANGVGQSNSVFGAGAARAGILGNRNSIFGVLAGENTTGGDNSFFGTGTGQLNTTGSLNTFYGFRAGDANTTGSNNTTLGAEADVTANNLTFATAIGAGSTVGTNNTLVLGRPTDEVRAPGTITGAVVNTTTDFRVNGVPALRMPGANNLFVGLNAGLNLVSQNDNTFIGTNAGATTVSSHSNTFVGRASGFNNTGGASNAFFGANAASANTTGQLNVAVGALAGTSNITGSSNTFIGYDADPASGDLSFATAIGADSLVSTSNSIALGRPGGEDTVRIPGNLITTGTATVNGNFVLGSGGTALFASPIIISSSGLGTAGGTSLCRNADSQIAVCSSSLRYKTNVNRSSLGLNLVKQLRPVTFDWKNGGMHDLGFGAEEVAAIEPLLVTYNEKGQVEGVKYDRVGVVLVNAVTEQQAEIESQKKEIAELRVQLDALRKLVCATNATAEICVQK